jgi:phosphatidylethanolamine/phosphatidyl-N-methylethanolamine N-methyltransferase
MKKTDQINLWKKYYSSDQENLYKNFFVRLLFDLGHRYIADKGKNINGKILDVGSGMGYHLKFEKASKKRTYICLDKDKAMIDRINDSYIQKIVGTCSKIPLKDKSVDLIIASHILEHLPKLNSDLKELNRILKNTGKIIVILPCDPGLLWRLLTFFTPSRWRLKRLGIDYDIVMKHEHINTFKTCMDELKEIFTIDHEKYYPFFIKNYDFNILCCLTLSYKQ